MRKVTVINRQFVIAQRGRVLAGIALPEESEPVIRKAVWDLFRIIEKSTGSRPYLVDPVLKDERAIHVGKTVLSRRLLANINTEADGFFIKTESGKLFIYADKPEGVSNGIYYFLREFVGVRWLWPGESGEFVPRSKNLIIGPIEKYSRPDFLWRDLGPSGPLWARYWLKDKEIEWGISPWHQEEMETWKRRNLLGGLNIVDGHSWGRAAPPEILGKKKPELFAMVNGKRDTVNFDGKHRCQPCATNHESAELIAEYVIDYFRSHPWVDSFSITPNDGMGFCDCLNCLRMDERKPGDSSAPLTESMLYFANSICEKVEKEFHGKILILCAYSLYIEPPKKKKPHPNLMIQYCLRSAEYGNEDFVKETERRLSGWARLTKHLGIYEYFIMGAWPDLPRLYSHFISYSIKKLKDLGFRYYSTQAGDGFAVNGFLYYVLSRLLWDCESDVDEILEDYCKKGFAEASPQMLKYFKNFISAWEKGNGFELDVDILEGSPQVSFIRDFLSVYPEQFVRNQERLLREGKYKVKDELAKTRIEFIAMGFEYFHITHDGLSIAMKIIKKGFDLFQSSPEKLSDSMEQFITDDRELARKFLDKWMEREEFILQCKGEFTLSYFWIRYNEYARNIMPLQAIGILQELLKKELQNQL